MTNRSKTLFAAAGLAIVAASVGAEPADRPAAKRTRGELLRVEEKTLILRPLLPGRPAGEAETVALPIDESASISLDGEPADLSALRPGMTVEATTIRGTLLVSAASPGRMGTVTQIAGRSFTLNVFNGKDTGKTFLVETDDNTRIATLGLGRETPPAESAFADLVEGSVVTVRPQTGPAKLILIHPRVRAATRPS
jgi:hypothetical protein